MILFLFLIDLSYRYPRKGTYTAKGLKKIYKSVLPGARRGHPKVLIVMTDGKSRDRVDRYSKLLHKAGVAVYAVGIGRKYNKKQLRVMASSPKNKHVITVGFSQLASVISKMQAKVCRG